MGNNIQSVCVVGAGYMGSQIALQCAVHGYAVNLFDSSSDAMAKSEKAVEAFSQRMIAENYLAEGEQQMVLGRISRPSNLEAAASTSNLVIEAISEKLEYKRALFEELDRICPGETILTTNSSSLRVSRIETAVQRRDRVLNTHFVQPIWQHPFVELMKGTETENDVVEQVDAFMQSIGMLTVHVRKESTGFVFNRIWRAVKKEALKVVDQGIASIEDIDRTWMIQMESPMGPLATMDVIGLDVIRDIEMVYYEESGDPDDAPPAILNEKVEAGQLGVKTGQGFYTYPNPSWQAEDFLKAPGHE